MTGSSDLLGQALAGVLSEVERHVAATGWNQPPRLYALVDTADLAQREPALAAQLDLTADDASVLTPVEQEDLPEAEDLAGALGQLAWPAEVAGCALAMEVEWGAGTERPEAEQVTGEGRLVVGVLRDGSRASVMRLRSAAPDEPGAAAGELLSGPDLAPDLADALADTLAD